MSNQGDGNEASLSDLDVSGQKVKGGTHLPEAERGVLLSKHCTILNLDGPPGETFAHFVQILDEPGEVGHQLYVDRETWTELGEPTEITITLEPGDRLN